MKVMETTVAGGMSSVAVTPTKTAAPLLHVGSAVIIKEKEEGGIVGGDPGAVTTVAAAMQAKMGAA